MGLYRIKKEFQSEYFEFVIDVSFQLDSFKEYIKVTEAIIEKVIEEKLTYYEQLLKEVGDREEFYSDHYEDYEIKKYTRQLYYDSIFISLYSFLEKKMYQLCKVAEENHLIKTKDISGEGIFKYQKYLKKVIQINLDSLNKEWELITKYNKLRNRLVHNPTNEIENNKENSTQIRLLKSIENLTVQDKGSIIEFQIENKDLLLDFCNVINRFLREICYEKAIFKKD